MITSAETAELLERAAARVNEVDPIRRTGIVTRSVGLMIESLGPRVAVGEEVRLEDVDGQLLSLAEVVGFEHKHVFSMPVGAVRGLRHGDRIVATGRHPRLAVGSGLLGRVVDANGKPLDGRGPIRAEAVRDLWGQPIPAMQRPRIDEPMITGIRAIDGLLTLGRGQRIGLFAGAGVGKSRLLGSIARHASDEVIVIALVGERNREVVEFVEHELGEAGLARAVVFVATSDEPALRRVRCALAATTAAEWFRSCGKHVTLLMDSLTRVAMALREIGLSTGEPPSSKGYTPSVFAALPRLLERAGRAEGGASVTGIYTVFVEGDDLNDPVSDAARAILDGHIVLSRKLAERSHYPAIDVLASTSRVMTQVTTREQLLAAQRLKRWLAIFRDNEDLVSIGAYRAGMDSELDLAVQSHPAALRYLQQDIETPSTPEQTLASLLAISEGQFST
jgi:flagellum-specific ATP synthase